jgi:hypothetical protein
MVLRPDAENTKEFAPLALTLRAPPSDAHACSRYKIT